MANAEACKDVSSMAAFQDGPTWQVMTCMTGVQQTMHAWTMRPMSAWSARDVNTVWQQSSQTRIIYCGGHAGHAAGLQQLQCSAGFAASARAVASDAAGTSSEQPEGAAVPSELLPLAISVVWEVPPQGSSDGGMRRTNAMLRQVRHRTPHGSRCEPSSQLYLLNVRHCTCYHMPYH